MVAQTPPPDAAPEVAEGPKVPEVREEPKAPTVEEAALEPPEAPEAPARPRARNRPQWGARREGQVSFGQNVVIRANESVRDLVLIGGSADIQGEVEAGLSGDRPSGKRPGWLLLDAALLAPCPHRCRRRARAKPGRA